MGKLPDNVKKQGRDRSKWQLRFDEPSLTKQEFEKQTNINQIMKNYKYTGYVGSINRKTGIYGDFTNIKDFKSAVDMVNEANNDFMSLPSKIRARFGHDPVKLLEFVSDPGNAKEAQELGLIETEGIKVSKNDLEGLESKGKGLPDDSVKSTQEQKKV